MSLTRHPTRSNGLGVTQQDRPAFLRAWLLLIFPFSFLPAENAHGTCGLIPWALTSSQKTPQGAETGHAFQQLEGK